MDYEMTINKWVPDYFDADAYLTPQFTTLAMQYAFNVYGFSDPEVDALIEEARSTTNTNIRQQAYEQVQEKIAEQMPMIFLYVPDLNDVVRYDIGGWQSTPTGFINAYELYRK
jgi:ABC-type transport system substrate-binding protein